jgi:hypothetical protein
LKFCRIDRWQQLSQYAKRASITLQYYLNVVPTAPDGSILYMGTISIASGALQQRRHSCVGLARAGASVIACACAVPRLLKGSLVLIGHALMMTPMRTMFRFVHNLRVGVLVRYG